MTGAQGQRDEVPRELGRRFRRGGHVERTRFGERYDGWDQERSEPCRIDVLVAGGTLQGDLAALLEREVAIGRWLEERLGSPDPAANGVLTALGWGRLGETRLFVARAKREGAATLELSEGELEPRVWALLAVARRVEALAELGAVHRGLSAASVWAGGDDVFLADLGLAKVPGLPEPDAGVRRWGLGYVPEFLPGMAPELIEAPAAADPRADVYALGALLYELLTGAPPPPVWSARRRIPLPSESGHVVPAALDGLTGRALVPRVSERLASATAFAEALEDWLAVGGELTGGAAPLAGGELLASGAPRRASEPVAPSAPVAATAALETSATTGSEAPSSASTSAARSEAPVASSSEAADEAASGTRAAPKPLASAEAEPLAPELGAPEAGPRAPESVSAAPPPPDDGPGSALWDPFASDDVEPQALTPGWRDAAPSSPGAEVAAPVADGSSSHTPSGPVGRSAGERGLGPGPSAVDAVEPSSPAAGSGAGADGLGAGELELDGLGTGELEGDGSGPRELEGSELAGAELGGLDLEGSDLGALDLELSQGSTGRPAAGAGRAGDARAVAATANLEAPIELASAVAPAPAQPLLPPVAFKGVRAYEDVLVLDAAGRDLEPTLRCVRQLDTAGFAHLLLNMQAVVHLGGAQLEALTEVLTLCERRDVRAGLFALRSEVRGVLSIMDQDLPGNLPRALAAQDEASAVAECRLSDE